MHGSYLFKMFSFSVMQSTFCFSNEEMLVVSTTRLKPWPNGRASSRKCRQVQLVYRFGCVAKSIGKFPRKSPKKSFKGRLSSVSLANNRLMDVTYLALTWVG